MEIDGNEVFCVVYDGKKSYYDVSITFSPLQYAESETVTSMFRNDFSKAADLINGSFSKELYDKMRSAGADVFPFWSDMTYKCSCRKTRKCEHVATVLHRIMNEIIYEPAMLFTLRGYRCDGIFAVLAGDVDFELAEPQRPPELTMEFYNVKKGDTEVSTLNPLAYYGTDVPDPDLSDLPESSITGAKVYHGKMRDEFYQILGSLTEVLKSNIKKF